MGTVLAVAALIGGIFFLEVGADRFTDTVGTLARRIRAPESVVGLLTAGAEWEELAVVILALVGSHPDVAVGDIIGSNIANLTGSFPLGLMGARPLTLDRSARIYALVMLGITTLAAAFLWTGRVTPIAGGVLIGTFLIYVASVLLIIRYGWLQPLEDEDDDMDQIKDSFVRLFSLFLFSLFIISLGAEMVVQGAVYIAHQAGLSEYVIGATVVAVGTTLPDKAISLIGGLRGQSGVVTANASGSNIFVLTLVLGISALASPSGLAVSPEVARIDVPILLAISLLIVLLFQRKSLHRRTGIALLALYIGYILYALFRGA